MSDSRNLLVVLLMSMLCTCVMGCPRPGGGGGGGGDDDDAAEVEGDEAGECSDGADNDGDGDFDCDDSGCEGSPDCEGGDDDDDDDDDDTTGEVELSVSVSFPFLEMAEGQGGDLLLPTYVAHLVGSSVSEPWWDGDVACLDLVNGGDVALSAEVTVELVGYSAAVSELEDVPAGGSRSLCLNPVMDLDQLYSLTSEANGQVSVRVEDADSGTLVWQQNDPVRIATRRDIFFVLNGAPARSSVAALARPNAPAVLDILDDMVELSWFSGSIGVGGYRAHQGTQWWPWGSESVPADSYSAQWTYLEAGEAVSFTADSDGADSRLYVMSMAEYQNLVAGNTFLVYWQEDIDTEQTGTFTASSAGYYYFVAYNYSTWFAETVTWRTSMTYTENVTDYLHIIYDYLQDLGINYINVASNFFEYSQQCLLPDEVINNGGGNCIDGTILFASLLEQMGVRPIVTFVPGHAFISVDSGPTGYNTVWSLETTMMGGSSTFYDALWAGGAAHAEAQFDGVFNLDVYLDEARSAGVYPMP